MVISGMSVNWVTLFYDWQTTQIIDTIHETIYISDLTRFAVSWPECILIYPYIYSFAGGIGGPSKEYQFQKIKLNTFTSTSFL